MWFKRKPRNRRLNSGTVLDVKLRSDQVRATRSRALAVGLGVTFVTVFCFYLLWRTGEWAMNQLVYRNPAFAIAEIDARTDGIVAQDQIKRWAGVKAGANLMALDLARVKRDLELQPVFKSVSVERVLPRTLRIRVTERVAVAQVNVPRVRTGGGLDVAVMHLDIDGFVMLPLDPRLRGTSPGQGEDSLPLITGVNPLALQVGRQLDSKQARAALELVGAFQESAMAAFADLKRVDVTAPEVLTVTTEQGSEIVLGPENLNRQLLRWREIYEQGMRHNKAIASLDLAVTNNIPARWLDARLQPQPVKPRPPVNNSRTSTRKRNV